jgi:citrate-Mg2+:H+ or citrate-Ca2+:H+ symporter, CitMHS family
MLAILGFLMIVTFMVLIMTKRMNVMPALVLTPVVFGIIGGFGFGLGEMILNGVGKVAPIGLMLMFALIYFNIMLDAGLFEPMVRGMVHLVGHDPMKICLGTTIISLIISVSGDGVSSALIVFAAFVPLYNKTGMNIMVLATLLALSNSIMNFIPWGGPLARIAGALNLSPNEIFLPLIPTMVIGAAAILALTWWFGRSERRRLNFNPAAVMETAASEDDGGKPDVRKRIFVLVNLLLTVSLLAAMVRHLAPLPVLFMVGSCVALLINYPRTKEQGEKLFAYAENAFTVISLILASGALIGIINDSGMLDGMAQSLVNFVPAALGPYFSTISAVISIPLLFLLSNDAYYFGLLPVIANVASNYGVPAVEIARSSMLGMPVHLLSPVLASLYLLAGILKIDIGAFQRFTLKWAIALSFVVIVAAVITGAIHVSS